MQTATAIVVAAAGLTLFAVGVYFIRFTAVCAPDESHVECFRSWAGVLGPFIAAAALLIAFQQYGLSEDTRNRQLRAYVSLFGGGIASARVDGDNPGIAVQIELKNSGTTPGYNFTTWIKPPLVLERSALPFGEPTPLSERTGQSIIAPSASAFITIFYRWQPNELEQVRRRDKAIFVWGGADYTDAFSRKRKFVFRIAVTGAENADQNRAWALTPHHLGYEAD